MNDWKKIFENTALKDGMSQEELVRAWQEIQADLPELSDIDLELTDFPTEAEKSALKPKSGGLNGLILLAVVGVVSLAAASFTLYSSISEKAMHKSAQKPKVILKKHQAERFESEQLENVSIEMEEEHGQMKDLNQHENFESEEQGLFERTELQELESLAVQGLNFGVVSPNLKVVRYNKDYNYKYLRNYKVYDYAHRSPRIEDMKLKKGLDPSFPNWNSFKRHGNSDGLVYREYEELLYKALSYMDKERYREVDLIMFSIIKSYPNDQNAWFYSGISAYRQKHFKEAVACFKTILDDHPHVFKQEAHWYYSLCLLELDEMVEAKKHLKEIAEAGAFYSVHAQNILAEIQ